MQTCRLSISNHCGVALAICGTLIPSVTDATPAEKTDSVVVVQSHDDNDISRPMSNQPDPGRTARLTRWIGLGYCAVILDYGYVTWWEGIEISGFRMGNEGWFGADTEFGGLDKIGHLHSSYLNTRLLSQSLRWAGNDTGEAARLTTLLVGGMMLAIEIVDGYTTIYGFSWEDYIMDLAGIGLGLWAESDSRVDGLFDFRVQYRASADARRIGEKYPNQDFPGQTYLLAIKASGIPVLRKSRFLRYLEFSVGYGTRGYRPTTPSKDRYLYYGISVNLANLLGDTMFSGQQKPGRGQKVANHLFEYVQIPVAAALTAKKF